MAVMRSLICLPLRSRTKPRRPQRDFHACFELLKERISSPGCIAERNSRAHSPKRRETASADDRRELIHVSGIGDIWSLRMFFYTHIILDPIPLYGII